MPQNDPINRVAGRTFSRRAFVLGGSSAVALALRSVNASAESSPPAILRFGVEMEIASLDPIRPTNNWEQVVAVNVYDPLVFPDPEKKVIPWIAESWQISDGGLTYTFKLKKGIPFHDGTELTSADVAFSMQRLKTVGGPIASYFQNVDISKISAPDPLTVQFGLKKADPAFLQTLFLLYIVNKKLVTANQAPGNYGEFGDYGAAFLQANSAGSGPFKVLRYRASEMVELGRFESYPFTTWTAKNPEKVQLQIFPELVTIATKLKSGELDIGTVSLPTQVQRQLAADNRFVVERHTQPTPWFVVMNNSRPPLDDVHVRRAIAYAYDSKTVTKYILGGGEELRGPVPAQLLGGCEGVRIYEFDMEKAKAELAQSKYSAEQLGAFQMEIAAVAASERFKNIALLLSTNLKKLGIKTQVKAVRWSDITAAQTKPETAFDFVVYYESPKVPHPNQILTYYTKAGWGGAYPPGGMYYDNPVVTDLIKKAGSAANTDESNRLLCDAVRQIAEDSPSIFSHVDVRQLPHWRYVKGFRGFVGATPFDLRFNSLEIDSSDPDYRPTL